MASLAWTGLEEFKEALRNLPDHLVGQASSIVDEAGELAFSSIYQAYPRVTGNLRQGLQKNALTFGRYGVGIRIVNRAKHAWLFENGSQARHVALLPPWPAANFGPNRGAMPPGHVFIPTSIRERTKMVRRLVELVRGEGFTVSNAP